MPIDRGALDAQLRDIGEGERWWEQREFRELPHILHSDERLRGLVNGKLPGPRRPRILPGARWLIVATDQRLICLQQERFGRKQVDFQPGQINGIQHGARLRDYQITLYTAQRRYRIRIAKADAFRFLGALAPLLPVQPSAAADLTPSWLPGVAAIAALPGMPDFVKAPLAPAPEYATRAELARTEAVVERLEGEVERLQQQVEFLEKLLQERAERALSLPGSPADS